MRIIAGQWKGRTLKGPVGPGVRPTSDRLRETLFNVLGARVVDASVLDGFAGTGALGLEALSRGASHVTFVEQDRRTLGVLGDNVRACGAEKACAIICDDFVRFSARKGPASACNLVLLDPPYESPIVSDVLRDVARWVTADGWVVLEHSRRRAVPSAHDLVCFRTLVAGDSALSFFGRTSAP